MPAREASTSAIIRPVTLRDVPIVRGLILQMLADSPLAFGDQLADAQSRSESEWIRFIENLTRLPVRCALLAADKTGPCGFVCGDAATPQAPPGTVLVSRLWVNPRRRGTGLGRTLMDAITKWAVDQGADQIGLGVTEMNTKGLNFLCSPGLYRSRVSGIVAS